MTGRRRCQGLRSGIRRRPVEVNATLCFTSLITFSKASLALELPKVNFLGFQAATSTLDSLGEVSQSTLGYLAVKLEFRLLSTLQSNPARSRRRIPFNEMPM